MEVIGTAGEYQGGKGKELWRKKRMEDESVISGDANTITITITHTITHTSYQSKIEVATGAMVIYEHVCIGGYRRGISTFCPENGRSPYGNL